MKIMNLVSGSSGNSTFVGTEQVSVLCDVGVSMKKIEECLNTAGYTGADIDAVLITHEHIDHVKGLGVFQRKYHIPVYATDGTIDQIFRMNSLGRLDRELFRPFRPGDAIQLKDLEIHSFSVMHDAADPVGYRIYEGNKKACVCTDLGCFTDYTAECLKDSDVLLLESNHDVNMLQVGHYPYMLKQRILGDRGHLSNASSGQLLSRVLNDHIRAIFLGHLSKENNIPELAFETVRVEIMFSESGYRAEELPIQVAKRSEPSALIEF